MDVVTSNTFIPDHETLTLTETPANTGTFVKQVTLAPLPVVLGNGLIEAAGGYTVTITYHDLVDTTAADTRVSAPYLVLTPAIQLLQNGSFEFGLDGWTLDSERRWRQSPHRSRRGQRWGGRVPLQGAGRQAVDAQAEPDLDPARFRRRGD
ncbi:MAG: hypothetical protein HND48_25935 [Chloroflexi bacterium]|nr:hypothetical protein [Chloroflexota bacterium]